MTGNIIQLPADPHQETLSFLPWYVTGKLDAPDRALVEAHLSGCPDCQAELRAEQGLRAAVAELPFEVEAGWARMRERVERASVRRSGWTALRGRLGDALSGWWRGEAWLRWVAVAQLVVIVSLGAAVAHRSAPAAAPAAYHALGSAPAPAVGNVVVIFQPDISERQLRETLTANHARLVDGPTPADAYVLRVPPAERTAALGRLRGQKAIELAEPVDSGDSP